MIQKPFISIVWCFNLRPRNFIPESYCPTWSATPSSALARSFYLHHPFLLVFHEVRPFFSLVLLSWIQTYVPDVVLGSVPPNVVDAPQDLPTLTWYHQHDGDRAGDRFPLSTAPPHSHQLFPSYLIISELNSVNSYHNYSSIIDNRIQNLHQSRGICFI